MSERLTTALAAMLHDANIECDYVREFDRKECDRDDHVIQAEAVIEQGAALAALVDAAVAWREHGMGSTHTGVLPRRDAFTDFAEAVDAFLALTEPQP